MGLRHRVTHLMEVYMAVYTLWRDAGQVVLTRSSHQAAFFLSWPL